MVVKDNYYISVASTHMELAGKSLTKLANDCACVIHEEGATYHPKNQKCVIDADFEDVIAYLEVMKSHLDMYLDEEIKEVEVTKEVRKEPKLREDADLDDLDVLANLQDYQYEEEIVEEDLEEVEL